MTTPRTDLQVHTEAFTRIGETRNVWQYDQEMDKLGPLLFPASQVSATPVPRVLWMPPSNPYMPVPTHQQPFTNTFRNTPYSPPAAVSKVGPAKYKAPAHKHAHHLHSIPPREKSTRTLIIDHMLWVHGKPPIVEILTLYSTTSPRQNKIRPSAGRARHDRSHRWSIVFKL